MTTEQMCKAMFVYFFEKVYRSPCPTHVIDIPAAREVIEKFTTLLKKRYQREMGPNFLYNYMLYQFGRYYEKVKKGESIGLGKITPKLIFGNKPFETYEGRRVEMDFLTTLYPITVELKASKEELSYLKGIVFIDNKIDVKKGYKDPIKAISSSGEDPLSTCIDMTDLFNHEDPSCQKCSMKEECKRKLKELYPQIYRRRNYE